MKSEPNSNGKLCSDSFHYFFFPTKRLNTLPSTVVILYEAH
mgnify:CR=1 FL=1